MRPGLGHHHIISLRAPSPTFLEPPVVIRIRFPGSELGVIQGSVQSVGDSNFRIGNLGCGAQSFRVWAPRINSWGVGFEVKCQDLAP